MCARVYALGSTGFVCYDDGCHLKRYASHHTRKELTRTAGRLSTMNIVVDKLHFRGHVDKWCQQHCNPHTFEELNDVRPTYT